MTKRNPIMTTGGGEYDARLMCCVQWVMYDYERRSGKVRINGLGCVDMGHTINLFRAIDPRVAWIETWNEKGIDTCYQRRKDGSWSPVVFERAAPADKVPQFPGESWDVSEVDGPRLYVEK